MRTVTECYEENGKEPDIIKLQIQGQWDISEDKGTCSEVWEIEFNP